MWCSAEREAPARPSEANVNFSHASEAPGRQQAPQQGLGRAGLAPLPLKAAPPPPQGILGQALLVQDPPRARKGPRRSPR